MTIDRPPPGQRAVYLRVATAVLVAACLGVGLTVWKHPTRLVAGPESMESRILDRMPIGVSVDDARRFLEAEGFECRDRQNKDFALCRVGTAAPVAIRRNRDFVYGRRESVWDLLHGVWQVALVYDQGRLTEVLVSQTHP